MISEKREQFRRFKYLINEGIGYTGFPCKVCPVHEQCNAQMEDCIATNKFPNDNIPTCEETIFHWMMTGEFLETKEE